MPALDFFLKEMGPKGQNQSRNLLVKGFSQIHSDIAGVAKMSTLCTLLGTIKKETSQKEVSFEWMKFPWRGRNQFTLVVCVV